MGNPYSPQQPNPGGWGPAAQPPPPGGPPPGAAPAPPPGAPPGPYGAPAPGHQGQPPAPAPPGYGGAPQPGHPGQPPAGYHGQQQHGYQGQAQGAPQGGQSTIVVNTKYFPLAWILAFVKPIVMVNGQQLPHREWGRTAIPVPAGQHHVHVHVPYFLPPQMGPADLMVPVQPGQAVELEYAAPLWAFSRGAMGYGPQKYPGVEITLVVLAIPVVLIFLMVLLAALA